MHLKIKSIRKMSIQKVVIARIQDAKKDTANAMREMYPALINANASIAKMIKLSLYPILKLILASIFIIKLAILMSKHFTNNQIL